MAYQTSFLDAVKIRRSVLSIAKESPISDARIEMCVSHAIKHAPSPFHVQSCRAIILFGDEHEKLWDIAAAVVKNTMPPAVSVQFESKIQGFRDGYGTVMFFEDSEALKALSPRFQEVAAKNPDWYEHAQGMTQFIAWTALASEGLGCSLQHYHPMIDRHVAETWGVPESWSLRAQLVFGKPTGPPRGGVEKEFAPLETRVEVYGRKDQV